MRKFLTVAAVLIIAAAGAQAFEADYKAAKELYESGLYRDMNAERQSPQSNQALQEKNEAALRASLGDIVVTARNIPEAIALVPKAMEVIRISEASVYGAPDLKGLLDDVPGLFVNRQGAAEAMSTLALRGAGSRYTLIMEDGIPVNDMLTGGVDLNMIDISNTDRVEIVKGGMSSVYGSDAVAGVVNVITGGKKQLLKLGGVYGTCGYYKYGAASNYEIFNVDYSISFNDENWMDYFENSDSFKRSAKAKVKFSNGFLHSQVTANYFKREMGVPFDALGYASPAARQFDENISAGISEALELDFMTVKIDGYLRSADLRFVNPLAYTPQDSKSIKKHYHGGVLGVYEEGGFVSVAAGYDADVKSIDSNMAGQRDNVNNAMMTNASAKLFGGSLVLGAGARVDINSQYGTHASENISAKYKFQDGLELRGSFDKSFSAPNFGQLYWPVTVDVWDGVTYIMEGNSGLKVEEFTSFEAGFSKKHDNMKEAVTWFIRDSSNMIAWSDTVEDGGPAGITVTSRMENVEKARTMGLEVKFEIQPFNFMTISAQYNLIFTEDSATNTGTAYVDGGNANNKNYRIHALLKLPYSAVLGITAEYVDYRTDYRGKPIEPYFLLNARAGQKLAQNMDIFLQVDNILDNKEYRVVSGMPMPGRIVYAGAELVF